MQYDDTDEEEEEEDSIWDDCTDPDYVQTPIMMRRRAVSTHYRPDISISVLFCTHLLSFTWNH